MAFAHASDPASRVHPVDAVLLTCGVPLFLGGLLSDIAYARTYQIQWSNFAAWLIAGAMVFTGLALAWTLLQMIRSSFRDRRRLIVFLLLLATFALGLVNSFIHARDAWGSMPSGLVLSIIITLLAAAATWLGLSSIRLGVRP